MTAVAAESNNHHHNQSIIAVSTIDSVIGDNMRTSGYTSSAQGHRMSSLPFSGFENRYLENNYNKSVFATIFLFANTLLKFFDGERCNEVEFSSMLKKLFGRLIALES